MDLENISNLTLVFKCCVRHHKKDDFKIIECKLKDGHFVSSENLYFQSKILKEWPELKERFPKLERIKIEYSTVTQNILLFYSKNNDLISTGYMTLVGVEDG